MQQFQNLLNIKCPDINQEDYINQLKKRYGKDSDAIEKRLINVTSFVYGKIYFPVKSNNLKELGKFIGGIWSYPNASGLQSLVWRYSWDEGQNKIYRKLLLNYNKEDCNALYLLVRKISEIIEVADSNDNIDFANKPKNMQQQSVVKSMKNQRKFLNFLTLIIIKIKSLSGRKRKFKRLMKKIMEVEKVTKFLEEFFHQIQELQSKSKQEKVYVQEIIANVDCLKNQRKLLRKLLLILTLVGTDVGKK